MKPTARTNKVEDETDVLTGSDNRKSKEKNDCNVDNHLGRDKMSIQVSKISLDSKTRDGEKMSCFQKSKMTLLYRSAIDQRI